MLKPTDDMYMVRFLAYSCESNCEFFDRTICSQVRNGEYLPQTGWEAGKCNENALREDKIARQVLNNCGRREYLNYRKEARRMPHAEYSIGRWLDELVADPPGWYQYYRYLRNPPKLELADKHKFRPWADNPRPATHRPTMRNMPGNSLESLARPRTLELSEHFGGDLQKIADYSDMEARLVDEMCEGK